MNETIHSIIEQELYTKYQTTDLDKIGEKIGYVRAPNTVSDEEFKKQLIYHFEHSLQTKEAIDINCQFVDGAATFSMAIEEIKNVPHLRDRLNLIEYCYSHLKMIADRLEHREK